MIYFSIFLGVSQKFCKHQARYLSKSWDWLPGGYQLQSSTAAASAVDLFLKVIRVVDRFALEPRKWSRTSVPKAPYLAFLIYCELVWLYQKQQSHAITIVSSIPIEPLKPWHGRTFSQPSEHVKSLASPCHCKSYRIVPIQPHKYTMHVYVYLHIYIYTKIYVQIYIYV